VKNHQTVPESEFSDLKGPIRLPHSDELPNVDLKVVNYHRPMLGTFHAKFMVVDRRIAIVQSDNIQDNDNLEFCAQLEGPIVDAVYDTALITWNDAFDPAPPCINSPAAGAPLSTFAVGNHGSLFDKDGSLLNTYQSVTSPMSWDMS
jgi:phosphatidylserine/phosphatidylglycerophosphate/cardiolipin synthase-like enzyme